MFVTIQCENIRPSKKLINKAVLRCYCPMFAVRLLITTSPHRWLIFLPPVCSVLPPPCTKDVYTPQGSTRDPWTVLSRLSPSPPITHPHKPGCRVRFVTLSPELGQSPDLNPGWRYCITTGWTSSEQTLTAARRDIITSVFAIRGEEHRRIHSDFPLFLCSDVRTCSPVGICSRDSQLEAKLTLSYRLAGRQIKMSTIYFNLVTVWQFIEAEGRAMAQAVSRPHVTAEAWVRALVSPCGTCGGQSGTVTGFSQNC
jgi:hypothetical protein